MNQAKSELGVRIHRAFREMAFTQQQIVHVEGLKQDQEDQRRAGRVTQAEYRSVLSRCEEKSRQLFTQLAEKSREIDDLRALIQRSDT